MTGLNMQISSFPGSCVRCINIHHDEFGDLQPLSILLYIPLPVLFSVEVLNLQCEKFKKKRCQVLFQLTTIIQTSRPIGNILPIREVFRKKFVKGA